MLTPGSELTKNAVATYGALVIPGSCDTKSQAKQYLTGPLPAHLQDFVRIVLGVFGAPCHKTCAVRVAQNPFEAFQLCQRRHRLRGSSKSMACPCSSNVSIVASTTRAEEKRNASFVSLSGQGLQRCRRGFELKV